ncbi:excalibur calcium-binding domain-containing protein [Shewanella aestuarii]|uniref:Cold shock domain-containing protein n=1 Tax=Shewanella aestuarii TaxID=1028752 RepID=A0A6G9QH64_9GAMM|nr:excalibur calcium-binding domain-containing protein [Shewanella aestuarii]QIR13407.1 cold shock domain-containing protein [Shewanella aestuarii]
MEKGNLVRWNDDKGFGFIKPTMNSDKTDVFIHISELKHMARKPKVGDEILFLREQQPDGKVKAIKASIEGVAIVASAKPTRTSSSNQAYKSRQPRSFLSKLIPLALVVTAVFGYSKYQQLNETPVLTNEDIENMQWQPTASPINSITTPSFRCEAGKTHCSQMRSCEEATFYIRNCPNTKMDGDGDGVPCERQLCN